MNILVDSGDYKCANMGDVAMLQAALRRLQQTFPEAEIAVVTANPQYLAKNWPGVQAVSQRGLPDYFGSAYSMAEPQPSLVRKLRGYVRTIVSPDVRERGRFSAHMDRADLIVVSGQGGITDDFKDHAHSVLGFIELAKRLNKPVVMFSQGLGPIHDPELFDRAKAILRRVNLIALRESVSGLPLLESLGVSTDNVITTGDDAIEQAYGARPAAPGTAIGINIRAARHNGISTAEIELMRSVFHGAAKKYQAPLLPLPIARHPDCKDARDIKIVLAGHDDKSDGGREFDTPLKIIRQVGRCRIVVTAAYHAAVFALSQGIPVVALARSEYVRDKFVGLRAQFNGGCQIVALGEASANENLAAAIDTAWVKADSERPHLIKRACAQVALNSEVVSRLELLTAGCVSR